MPAQNHEAHADMSSQVPSNGVDSSNSRETRSVASHDTRHYVGLDLSDCLLKDIEAKDCRFTRCEFDASKLEDCSLEDCEAIHTIITGCDVSATELPTQKPQFRYCTIQSCRLKKVSVRAGNLEHSQVRHAILTMVKIKGGDLCHCSLENVNSRGTPKVHIECSVVNPNGQAPIVLGVGFDIADHNPLYGRPQGLRPQGSVSSLIEGGPAPRPAPELIKDTPAYLDREWQLKEKSIANAQKGVAFALFGKDLNQATYAQGLSSRHDSMLQPSSHACLPPAIQQAKSFYSPPALPSLSSSMYPKLQAPRDAAQERLLMLSRQIDTEKLEQLYGPKLPPIGWCMNHEQMHNKVLRGINDDFRRQLLEKNARGAEVKRKAVEKLNADVRRRRHPLSGAMAAQTLKDIRPPNPF